MIDNLDLCRERYTEKHFYAKEKAPTSTGDPPLNIPMPEEWIKFTYRMAFWGREYENVKQQHHHNLSRLVRQQLAPQPHIQDELLAALKGDVCRSYRDLSRSINGWCCATTIETWFKSHPDYDIFSKNIKPGLTSSISIKQVNFAAHVHNYGGFHVSRDPNFCGSIASRNSSMLDRRTVLITKVTLLK